MLATIRWRGAPRATRSGATRHRAACLRTARPSIAIAVAAMVISVGPIGAAEPASAQSFCGWQANHPGTTGPWGFSVTPGVEALPTQLVVRTTPGTPPSLSRVVDHAIATMNTTAGAGWRRGPEVSAATTVSTADRRGRPPLGELWVVGSPGRYRGLPPGTYTSAIVERPRGGPAMPVATLIVLTEALGWPRTTWQQQVRAVVHEFGHAAGLDHHFAPWGGVCQTMSYRGGGSYGAGDTFGLQVLASRAPATPPWGNPFGRVDLARSEPGGVRLVGWAIDPDTAGSIGVHLYVNGRFAGATTASRNRPDVGRAYPFWGAGHGFEATVGPGAGGPAQVCAYALNAGVGWTNPLLGCVTTPARDPFGRLDLAQRTSTGVRLAGWAVDPDTIAPITVHLYVDGRFSRAIAADLNRPDVGRAHPAWGPVHGFDTALSLPATGRPSQLCAYAINVGPGTTNPLLGCALAPP